MKKQEFLTPKQVCTWLALPPSTLADLRARGDGPAFTRLSARNIRYARRDVSAWIARNRCQAGSPAGR
jgi:predicted DNA-binding transcriptional regulator AlpA